MYNLLNYFGGDCMNTFIQKRNLVGCIIFSFVTCGIYTLFWLAGIINDICDMKGEARTGGRDILLSFVTCGLYAFYLYYRIGEDIDFIKNQRGLPSNNTGLLYLILSLLGLSIITIALAQNSINELC